MRAGANINHTNMFGNTPLMMAAASNPNPGVVRLLIDLGADVFARNSDGRTALDCADFGDYGPSHVREVKSFILRAMK